MQDSLLDDEFINNSKLDFNPQEALRINRIKTELNEQTAILKQGKTALWVLVFIQFVSYVFLYIGIDDADVRMNILIGGGIVVVLFALAAEGFNFNRKVALIAGFSLYVLLMLADVIADPSTIFKGIVVKIAVFYFMIRAIMATFKIDDFKSRLSKLGVPISELELIDELKNVPKTQQTID